MRFVSLLLLNFLAFGSSFIAGPPFVIPETRAVCSAVNNVDVDVDADASVGATVDVDVDVDVPCSNEDEENTGHMPVPVLFYPGKLNRVLTGSIKIILRTRFRAHVFKATVHPDECPAITTSLNSRARRCISKSMFG